MVPEAIRTMPSQFAPESFSPRKRTANRDKDDAELVGLHPSP